MPGFCSSCAWLVVLVWHLVFCLSSVAAERQILQGHLPGPVNHLAPSGRLDAAKHLKLSITLPSRDPDGLANLLHGLYDPTSPQYRHFITSAEFAERFGPTPESYEALADFAKTHGLTVTKRHSNRLVLGVEGAVTDIEKTFHVTMRTYQHPNEGRQFFSPDSEPSSEFAGPILHIGGLDDYAPPRAHSRPRLIGQASQATGNATPNSGSGPSGNFAGNDFRAAYLPGVTLTGTGQSVGLLEFDGYYAGDITKYEAQFGLPNVPLVNVPIDGGVTSIGSGNSEVCLDIEMVIAMAPGVSAIYVYEAASSWTDMLNRMATDNLAKQLSCSWYIPNGGPNPGAEVIFQQMAAQGQSFFSASGDSDAYTGLIPFPGDSPSITQVGGTTLSTTGPGGSYVSEKVWNWGNGVGSSGGVSTNYSIPSWQQGINMTANLGSTIMRNVPDVALTADKIWVTYNNGSSASFGGTSCAAPLWAAFMALVNQQGAANGLPPLGFLNPTLYNIGKGAAYTTNFHDTTNGNNFSSSSPTKFPAASGYDLATGWGSPTPALLATLSTPSDPLQVSGADLAAAGPVSGPFGPGATYTLKNNGAASLDWTLSSTQNWVTATPLGGTLAAGDSTTISVTVNSNASSFAIGTYQSTLSVTDVTSGVIQNRPALVTVLGPPSMTVTPSSAFASTGNVGGPFNPPNATYTITNTGAPAITWTAGNTSNWLSLSSSGGTLASGASTTLTASITTAANTLPLGAYNDTITFTNATNGVGNTSTSATLNVANQVPVPLPPQSTTYSGMTRGYWFTAPTTFVITGLMVPADASTGAQSIAVLKLNSTPPTYPSTTNGFTTLFLTQNNPASGIIPVSLQVNQGDIIGIMGWRGGINSYGTSPFSTQILGQNVTLSRFGMQYSLDTTTPQNVWKDTTAGYLSRVSMYVSGNSNTPVITSPFSASATVGQPFFYQIAATNTPTLYSVTALPPGLSIDTRTGAISGTPTVVGATPVTISATNASGTGSATLTITVQSVPPVITSTLNASGTSGAAFSYQITATNNPTSFSATGLPAGLSVNTTSGLIGGTPTTAGTSNVTISATNSGGTGSATLILNIALGVPTITSPLNSSATVSSSFSYSIAATGSPTSYNAVGLPAGLSVNTSTGLISGTPAVTGISNVTISATNSIGTGSATWVINVLPISPAITSATYVTGVVGTPFSYSITATNNPTSYNATGLPPGLSVNTSSGIISGTPTSSGYYYPTISATNAGGTGTAYPTIYIAQPPPVITSPVTASGGVNFSFSYTITATGSPYNYSATGLPSGLGVNSSTGVISGIPSTPGTSNVTISAQNSYGTGSATLVLTITSSAPVITSSLNVNAAVNAPFTYTISAMNNPTSFSAVGLPVGWTLNTSTGVIAGTPATGGTANILIGASNSVGTATAMLSIQFQTPPAAATAFYYNGVGWVGGGNSEMETPLGGFVFTASKNYDNGVSISITGPNSTNWEIDTASANNTPLTLGTYVAATRFPFQASGTPGFSWYGDGRGDNQSTGTFNVLDIQYGSGSTIVSFAADFVQYDELATNAWDIGSIRYNSTVPITYPGAPVVVSSSAAPVNLTAETLNATINPAGPPTSVYFQWGTTNAYGNTTATQSLLAGVTGNPVSASLTGLQSGTIYHYRVVATSSWGTSMSADATFTAGSAVPVIFSPSSVGGVQGASFSYQVMASNSPTSYTASGLPPGLSVNSSTGLISGTVAQAGNYPLSLSASNGAGTGSATFVLIVATPEPAITSILTATANLNTPFNYTITGTNSPTSFNAIGLPPGLSVNPTTGVISGNPTSLGTSEITLSATNAFGTGEAALILTVSTLPPVVSYNSVTAIVNQPYSSAITATNNPTSYSATGLPPGLSLNSATGVISGTPTTTGSYTATIMASNASGSGSNSLYIYINPPPPVISSPLTAAGVVGGSFTYTITATGSPTSYNATGLPAGLGVNSSTGVISGIPSMLGTSSINISATNSGGTTSATLVLTVAPAAPVITSPLASAAGVNIPFNYTITATNSPTSFAATGLPTGLSLNTSTGVISGTPTATGVSNVAIQASNSVGSGTASFNLTVSTSAPAAATAFYYNGVGWVGGGNSEMETPLGGFVFTASKNYDNGVSISITGPNSTNWEIDTASANNTPLTLGTYVAATRFPFQASGTPGFSWYGDGRGDNQSTGTFNVLDIQYGSGSTIVSFAADFVQYDELATNAWDIGSIRYNSTVPITYPGAPLVVSCSAAPVNLTTETLNAAINPAGPPTSVYFQWGTTNAYGNTTATQSLLAGVTGTPVSASLTGLQSGTVYHYRVVATSSWGTSMSADATFTTATSSPVIFSTTTAGSTAGQPLSYQIQGTNSPTSYTASGLPSGLSLNSSTGLISGTVSQAGVFPVNLSATNALGTGTASLSITINPQPVILPASLSAAYAGTAYQQSLSASGGTIPYSSLTISNFNAGTTGLTSAAITPNLSAGTITISGTPTGAGSLSFTANLADAAGAMFSQVYNLTVNAALAVPVMQPQPSFASGTACTVSWNAVAGAASYDAQCASSANFGTILATQSVTNTSATFTGLTNATTYYYRVRANSGPPASATSQWSLVASATQDTAAPVVTITSPSTGAYTTLGTITVTGTATDGTAGIASVTVNGIAATTTNGYAQWAAVVPVSAGPNVITAIARDNVQPTANVAIATVTVRQYLDSEGKGIPDWWKTLHGMSGTGSGALVDPNHTGYSNLLCYAFNITPAQFPNSPPVTTAQVINPNDGLPYLTMTYRRLINAVHLSYTIESSSDLMNWSSLTSQIIQTTTTPLADGVTETVTVRIGPLVNNGGAMFSRIRVSSL